MEQNWVKLSLRVRKVSKGSHKDALTVVSGSTQADRRTAELRLKSIVSCIRSVRCPYKLVLSIYVLVVEVRLALMRLMENFQYVPRGLSYDWLTISQKS